VGHFLVIIIEALLTQIANIPFRILEDKPGLITAQFDCCGKFQDSNQ